MGEEPGGSGGLAPRFRPRRARGVRGLAPGLGHGVQGVGGLGGLLLGLCHGVQGGPGGLPPTGLGHSAWN